MCHVIVTYCEAHSGPLYNEHDESRSVGSWHGFPLSTENSSPNTVYSDPVCLYIFIPFLQGPVA